MKPYSATTYELVDMEQAARELIDGLNISKLCENSLGILFCDSELQEVELLLSELSRELGFEIVGCTTQSTMNQHEGISEMSSTLLVLTADDCRFCTGLSLPIEKKTCRESVEALYRDMRSRMAQDPVMMMIFPPINYQVMADIYPQVLSELSGNRPVFGGIQGYNAPYGVSASVYGGRLQHDRLLMIMMEGNLRPLFSSAVQISHLVPIGRTITKSYDNVIQTIDDMTVPQYLESIGLDPQELADDDTDLLYVSNPLLLTREDMPVEEYHLVRTFQQLDLEKGTGTCIAEAPQGHLLQIGQLTRRDVEISAERSISELLQKILNAEMADPSYQYTTVIAISCAGRYVVITPQIEGSSDLLTTMIPDSLCMAGYYSYGEFVPTSYENGKAVNTAQNESLTLCAF